MSMHDPRRYLAASVPALVIAGLTPLGAPTAQAWPAQIITLLLAVIVVVLLLRRTTPAQGASAPYADAPEATAEAMISRLLQRLAGSNLLALMAVDREARVHAANDAALDLVGHARDELEQGRLSWNAIAPPAWHDLGKLVLDVTIPRNVRAGDTELVHRNGARVSVRIEVTPLDSAAGHFLVLMLDTSRARRTEAELAYVRTEFERHKVLSDSTPVALFAKEYRGEAQGRYILANPMAAHIIGVSRLVDRTDFDLFPPEVAAVIQANDRRVIEGGAPVIVEEWAPDARTGKMLCFISTKVPLRDTTAGRTASAAWRWTSPSRSCSPSVWPWSTPSPTR
jgi:PAS domain S-box-containing protein